jgi:two-component system response regulator FixJ
MRPLSDPLLDEERAADDLGRPRTVYVIDEDRVLRRITFEFLSAKKFAPRAYANAQDFIDNISHLPPGCLLLGKLGAEFDALRLIKSLGERIAEFPVVVTASHGDVAAAVQAMKLGASDVLESTFDREVIPAMLGSIFVALESRLSKVTAARRAKSLVQSLSPREREVLSCIICGFCNKSTARHMGLSLRTVEMYRKNMMGRLQVNHLADALRLAFEANFCNASVASAAGRDHSL